MIRSAVTHTTGLSNAAISAQIVDFVLRASRLEARAPQAAPECSVDATR
jgi:hypothetical protein